MHRAIVDAGPFIHLAQIGEITLLKRFPSLFTPATIISEISLDTNISGKDIHKWRNLRIVHVRRTPHPQVEKVIKDFELHLGESDVLHLASQILPAIILTDDLEARKAAESLGIEIHGTVGIIAYAFHNRWISLKKAEESLTLFWEKSSLFITFAIIERAVRELRRHT